MKASTAIYRTIIKPGIFGLLAYLMALIAIRILGMTSILGWTIRPDWAFAAVFIFMQFIPDESGDSSQVNDIASNIAPGVKLYENGKYDQALQSLTVPAEQGIAHAQYLVGLMIHNGMGCQQDYEKGAQWLIAASNGGDAAAQNYTGVALLDGGPGFEKNTAQGNSYLQLSMSQGYADAFANMGHLYLHGLSGVQKDPKMAKVMLERGAKLGSEIAKTTLNAIEQGLI